MKKQNLNGFKNVGNGILVHKEQILIPNVYNGVFFYSVKKHVHVVKCFKICYSSCVEKIVHVSIYQVSQFLVCCVEQ